jgi:hypothetical protein
MASEKPQFVAFRGISWKPFQQLVKRRAGSFVSFIFQLFHDDSYDKYIL